MINEEKLAAVLENFIESDRLLNAQIKDLTDLVKLLNERVEKLERQLNSQST